MFLNDIHVDVV